MGIILDMILVISLGILAPALIFYIIYRWEKSGVWNDIVDTKEKRRNLKIVAGIAIISAIAGGIAINVTDKAYPLLAVLVPVAMSMGVYFLAVSLFYKTDSTE